MVISITAQPGDSEDQPQLATEEQGERWAQTVAVSLCARTSQRFLAQARILRASDSLEWGVFS